MESSLALRYMPVNSLARIARLSAKLLNMRMETIEDIRQRNLRTLIARYPTQAAFADAIGKSPSQVSQWTTRAPSSSTGTPRTPSSEICREIEKAVGEPIGWMDHDHTNPTATPLLPYQKAILEVLERMDEPKRKAFQAAGVALAESTRATAAHTRKRA